MSLRFITDEDVPRSTARVLRDAGFDAVDVRDVGLRGKSDEAVFDYAKGKTGCSSPVIWASQTF